MSWTVVAGDTTYVTAGWPLWIALAAPVLGLVAVLVSILFWGRGLGRPVLGVNLAFFSVFAGMVTAGLPWLVVGASTLTDEPHPLRLFRELLLYEAWAAGAGVAILGFAAALWVGTPRGDGAFVLPWERIGLGAGVVVTAGVGLLHVVWIGSVGPIPALEPELPAKIHARRVLDVTLDLPGWDVPDVHVVAGAAGPYPFTLTASRRGVSATRTFTVEAGQDRLAEGIRLQVGDEYIYEETTTWHDQMLWFVSAPGRVEGPRTRVRVKGERVEKARRLLDVEVTHAGETTNYVVFPWEGKALLEDGETVFWSIADLREEDGTYACTFAPFSESCRCVTRAPGDPIFLSGPARCSWSSGNAVSTGVSIFLAIVTVGLVLQDPDRTHYVELVASGNGPQMPDTRFAAPTSP